MKDWIKICIADGALAGWLCLLVSLGLLVASFILPPTGIIDSSVLAGVGELIGFGVIFKLPQMVNSIKDGKSMKVTHGDTTVEIESSKDE